MIMHMTRVRVAVAGASGYAGGELLRLLLGHPSVEVGALTANSNAGETLGALQPHLVPLAERVLEPTTAEVLRGHDVVFLALPDAAAADLAPTLVDAGIRVIDLSGAFRLRDQSARARWYPETHRLPADVAYRLTERERGSVARARLVANPGCYPTAAILGLAPLARAGLIADVVIDAKSGVSGAGRGATPATHFIAANENVAPYKITGHRHTPEIEQELAALGAPLTITFTPHLLPLAQGELVSCYVPPARELGEGELLELYDDAYAREPFVELREGPVGVIDVRDTNYCRISVHEDPRTGRVLVFAAIDNLWKGAASQAVQNLNLMFGLDEREGLR